ncbi:MAG TPA: uracil-DNA glycosylase [Steroidobacteraceae bacterium]|nr:uracil-DNA glycosylase [Steroidobacteraceae bacterium]
MKSPVYDPDCTLCPRLAAFLDEGKRIHPDYFCAPVPSFGDPDARLLLVGLAPGFHGANATGRPFTGDYAGILLYETLYEFGLSTAPVSVSADDGLRLIGCRISNSVKCVPPQNKPLPVEIANCNRYLAAELARVADGTVLLALGAIAHNAALRALGLKAGPYPFAHGAEHALPRGLRLVDSYHCSRYNTNTRRLTVEMFREVVGRAASLAGIRRRVRGGA